MTQVDSRGVWSRVCSLDRVDEKVEKLFVCFRVLLASRRLKADVFRLGARVALVVYHVQGFKQLNSNVASQMSRAVAILKVVSVVSTIQLVDCVLDSLSGQPVHGMVFRLRYTDLLQKRLAMRGKHKQKLQCFEARRLGNQPIAYFCKKLVAQGGVLERTSDLHQAFQRFDHVLAVPRHVTVFRVGNELHREV